MAITKEFITKIEGHGSLNVDWTKNKVELHLHEGERLFEGLLVGRAAEEAYWITPRICGVCPIAHNLASVSSVENALGVEISATSKLLRDLMQCAQMIQSHVLHLFFLVLPDYIGLDSAIELAQKDPESFGKALALKELGDAIAQTVAGRNVHPTTTTIGGFHKVPTKEDLEALLEKIVKTRKAAEWAEKLFCEIKYPALKVELQLLALDGKEINSISSFDVGSSKKEIVKIPVAEYKKNIEEELREYSTAKFSKFQGKEMLIGSLARLAVKYHQDVLGNNEINPMVDKLDFKNPFHNIMAQAIELFEYHKKAQVIIGKLLNTDLDNAKALPDNFKSDPSLAGVGAIEAPRGGLYHEIHLDKDGTIKYANIITPTAQNLTSIEKSAAALLEQYAAMPQDKKGHLLEMLVRAYDPCITCAVH